jgi:UDP-glucose 4-epimerase
LGKSARLLPVPESLLRQTLRLSKGAGMVDRLFGSLVVDSSHARETLGWQPPIPMAAELANTVQAYQQAS